MALLAQVKSLKIASGLTSTVIRAISSHSKEVERSVFISQSNDIFSNLALEDWIYRHFDFSKHRVLLLWKNSPCVVVGRHQNPWREAHIGTLAERGIPLARRNSGGGTVYHDQGNLNLTFFTPREAYDRKANLTVISSALRREWGIETIISPRDDLILEGDFKISGTASKLGRPNAYHHCTLLGDVDLGAMRGCLSSDNKGIETNATGSVRSAVRNLCQLESSVTLPRLLGAIGREYLRSDEQGFDRGSAHINKQRGFSLVNPTDDWFPGLEKARAEFASWAWRYGKTPDFTVTRDFQVPQALTASGEGSQLKVQMRVTKGKMAGVTVTVPPGFVSGAPEGEVPVISGLEGQRFTEDAVSVVEEAFAKKEKSSEKKRFVAECVRRVVQ